MQQASLMGVLKIVLIILLVYYGLKLITRIFGPLLLQYITKKTSEKIKKQFESYEQPYQTNKEETILRKKPVKKSSNKDVGEYIDYEEID